MLREAVLIGGSKPLPETGIGNGARMLPFRAAPLIVVNEAVVTRVVGDVIPKRRIPSFLPG